MINDQGTVIKVLKNCDNRKKRGHFIKLSHLLESCRKESLSFSMLVKGYAKKEEVTEYPRAEVAVISFFCMVIRVQ